MTRFFIFPDSFLKAHKNNGKTTVDMHLFLDVESFRIPCELNMFYMLRHV